MSTPWFIFIFVVFVLFIFAAWQIMQKSKTVEYPGVSLVYEGGGIRRGLNPVEVARLLAFTDGQIYFLALVGIFEKGFVYFDDTDKILPAAWLQTDELLDTTSRTAFRTRQAYQHDQILMPYEDVLLELFIQSKGASLDQARLALWFSFLDKHINQKISGYHQQASLEYYVDFIFHRMKEIWITSEDIHSNILWVLCASFDQRTNTQKVQEALRDFSPDWLPAHLHLNDLMGQA